LYIRFLHIVLALLVFISSTGFLINKHYCQGALKETAFLVKAKSCHERNAKKHSTEAHAGMPPNCPMHQSKSTDIPCEEKKDCCNNESEFVKLETDQEVTTLKLPGLNIPVFTSIVVFALTLEPVDPEIIPVHFQNYRPPPILYDVPATLQTFLL
jgi:hypothetical protein